VVYKALNHWVPGLCPKSGILNTRQHNVSETGSSSALSPPLLRTKTDPASEALFFVLRIPDDEQSPETQEF
jgi:hypothetical protein